MKFYGEHFYEDLLGTTEGGGEGTHQAARRVPGAAPLLATPGTLLGARWPPSVPPFAYISPLGWKPLKKSRFRVSLSGPGVSVCNSSHDAITWRAENRTHLSKKTRPSTERSRKASNVRGIPSRPDDQLRWVLIVRSQV